VAQLLQRLLASDTEVRRTLATTARITNVNVVSRVALVSLLIEKGVFTSEEFAHAVKDAAQEMGVELSDESQRPSEQGQNGRPAEDQLGG